MDDIYQKALYNGYGLHLYSALRTRRGLICKTDKGLKELRKVRSDSKTIIFENAIKKHLFDNGFKDTDLYFDTTEGKPYYNVGDQTFVLADYIDAKDIDEEDNDTIEKIGKTMATIHKLSRGATEDGNVSLGKLPETWEKRRTELKRIKKRINSESNYSPVDVIIIKNYRYFLERTEKAQSLLNSTAYNKIAKEARDKGSVCHNNFKGDTIRMKEDGESFYVTGFEKSAYDCRTTDISDYVRRCIKSKECTAETIDGFINGYNSEETLSDEEIKIIGAMVLFPSKFFKICGTHFNKRRVCQSNSITEKLSRCIEISEKEESILKTLKML